MRRRLLTVLRLFFGIILLILVAILLYDYGEERKRQRSTYALSLEEQSLIRTGDIILRAGYGFVSEAIVMTLGDTCGASHCGIIIRNGDELLVIHTLSPEVSESGGMQQCSLNQFVRDSKQGSVAVVRYKNGDGERIAAKATYYLGKQVPFDRSFDLRDSSTFFCSEVPYRILYDEFGFDLLQGAEPVIGNCKFSLFLDTASFSRVIN